MSAAGLGQALGTLWMDVLRHLWQSALILLALFVVARVLRTAPARWSHRLWLAGLAKLFVPLAVFGPWVRAALQLGEAHGTAPAGGLPGFQILVSVIGADGRSASASLAERVPAPFWIVCTAVYGVIACALLLRAGRDLAATRRLAQSSLPVCGDRAARLASALARAGLSGHRVVVSGMNQIPAVVGTLRPRIVLPLRLLDEADVDELTAVLLHEEMHRRHADPAIALLQRLTTALLFFFPLLPPLQRRIREAAELRCDEGALQAGAQPAAYARALALTVQLGLDPSPASAALGDGSPSLVARRIDRLQELGRIRLMMKHRIAIGFAVALLVAAIFLPVTPDRLMARTAGPGMAKFDRVGNLSKPVTVQLEKTPAAKAIAAIAAQSGVEIAIDGPPECCPVDLVVSGVAAGEALESVGRQAGVRFAVVGPNALRAVFPPAMDPDVTMPEVTHRVDPVYPKDALTARAQGLVVVTVMVGSDGTVSDIQVMRGVEGWPSLDQAAIDAVRAFTFKPATRKGEPFATRTRVGIEFSMNENAVVQ